MFIQEPLLKILPFSDGWELATDARYVLAINLIIIPKGFKTDFASIPMLFQNLIKVNGKHRLAALLHDYLYAVGGRVEWNTLTRKECDRLFLGEMKFANVKYLKRYIMYYGVRIFGGRYWIKQQGEN